MLFHVLEGYFHDGEDGRLLEIERLDRKYVMRNVSGGSADACKSYGRKEVAGLPNKSQPSTRKLEDASSREPAQNNKEDNAKCH